MLNLKVQALGLGNFLFRFARDLVLSHIYVKEACVCIFIFTLKNSALFSAQGAQMKVWWTV